MRRAVEVSRGRFPHRVRPQSHGCHRMIVYDAHSLVPVADDAWSTSARAVAKPISMVEDIIAEAPIRNSGGEALTTTRDQVVRQRAELEDQGL